jgi:hypothetical protein
VHIIVVVLDQVSSTFTVGRNLSCEIELLIRPVHRDTLSYLRHAAAGFAALYTSPV